MTEPAQFIIVGDPIVLRPLLDIFGTDKDVSVVSTANDSRTDPVRLVVAMEPARAQALSIALGSLVVIEPDQAVFVGPDIPGDLPPIVS